MKRSNVAQENAQKANDGVAKGFVKGALVLSIAGLITKILSAIFRVPLGNLIGDTGMGYYQTAYPIYTLFSAIAIIGIPSTLSKLVAEKRVLGEYQAAKDLFEVTMKLMTVIGAIVSILIFLGTPFMIQAFNWAPETKYSLWGLALSPFFICIMGVLRGYFQGMEEMGPTAISQVIENLVRVVVGLTLAILFLPDLGKAAGGASFGGVIGGIGGALALGLSYRHRKQRINKEIEESSKKAPPVSFGAITKKILIIAIPISIGAAVNAIINFLDSILVIKTLTGNGLDISVATQYFGQLGKVTTFINFPLTFGMALVVGLVPTISAAVAKKDHQEIQTKIELGIRLAVLIALPASIGLSVLANPIMNFIYASAPDGGNILTIAALSIVFIMLGQAFTGILQGIGKVWHPVIGIIIAATIKALLTPLLVATPLNIVGAPVASIMSYFVFTLYNYIIMKKYTDFKLKIGLVIIKPLISAMIMGIFAYGCYDRLSLFVNKNSFMQSGLITVASIGIGIIVYFTLIFVTGAITKKDIKEILNKKEK